MKRLILAAILITGFSPAMAQSQSQRGLSRPPSLEQRIADLEREAADRARGAERQALEADLAKPCTAAAAFGCRTK